MIDIISIEPCHRVATRQSKPLIDGSGRSIIALAHQMINLCSEAVNDLHGTISAGTIYDNVLQINAALTLSQNTANGLFQKTFTVEVWRYNANFHGY